MARPRVNRRLAAVLAADAVAYSRLMGEDEAGTHAELMAHRRELIDPEIDAHGGRVVKSTGDGVLAEFASVVDATACAVAIQHGISRRNKDVAEDRRIEFRIGINLGDVIVEDDDIYGDGVNVAARLEALAEPGGVCVSRTVFENVKDKLDCRFGDLGELALKNIADPVHVYRIVPRDQAATATGVGPAAKPKTGRSVKPSIAVLPFQALGGKGGQEYLAEGIAEDLIVGLHKFRWLTVTSPRSSFAYGADTTDTGSIAHELSVRYILEGTIRRSARHIRINVKLLDTFTAETLWAERYDREFDDLFAVQDDIAERIVSAVGIGSLSVEQKRARRSPLRDMSAWELIMRAHWHLRRLIRTDNAKARELLTRAIDEDSEAGYAYSDLAFCHVFDALFGWSDDRSVSVRSAERAARRAITLDSEDALGQAAFGFSEHIKNEHDRAVASLEKSIRLNPNLADAYGFLAMTLGFVGDLERATSNVERAIRLSPHDPMKAFWSNAVAMAAYMKGEYPAAAEWAERSVSENPDYLGGLRVLAASYGQLGHTQKAKNAVARLLSLEPKLTCDSTKRQLPFRSEEGAEAYVEGLGKAGLPEE